MNSEYIENNRKKITIVQIPTKAPAEGDSKEITNPDDYSDEKKHVDIQ